MLEVKNLSKSFTSPEGNPVEVLKGISLHVEKGEFLSIVGPSGSGKTTFLNIISGLDPDYSGVVKGGGNRKRQPFAFVFQDPTLFNWRTVWENTVIPHEINRRYLNKNLAREYLEAVGLISDITKYPDQLSGGMKARVAIARAFAMEPNLMLMDEPFGALDEFTRLRLNEILNEIWMKTRPTIIFVTHKISEAILLSDRLLVFSNRPVEILDDIKIELPRPRKTDIRYTPEFYEYEKKIYNMTSRR